MKHTPLEDPSLSRGAALSLALAKELAQLFQTVCQKACFAQMASMAQQYGLRQTTLPVKLLQVTFQAAVSPAWTAYHQSRV